jgi:hypothetical protein
MRALQVTTLRHFFRDGRDLDWFGIRNSLFRPGIFILGRAAYRLCFIDDAHMKPDALPTQVRQQAAQLPEPRNSSHPLTLWRNKMNAKKLIAALAVLAASTSAFAGNIEAVDQSDFVSTKSRAEVQAELAQAYAQGFHPGSTDVIEFKNVASTKTRGEVQAELARGFHPGSTDVIEFTNVASTKTRDEVRKELSESKKDHQFSNLYIG